MDWLRAIAVAFVAWLKGFLDGQAAERQRQQKRADVAEDIAERERGEAAALDDEELAQEVAKWTKPKSRS